MSTSRFYTLNKVKQLIDLNKNVTNFRCRFTVKSRDGKSFQGVVVNQGQLDSDNYPFEQSVNGSLEGEVEMVKNIYQNFYLILVAPESTIVDVNLTFEELPEYIPQPSTGEPVEGSSKTHWMLKWAVIVVIFAFVVGIAYMSIRQPEEALSSITPTNGVVSTTSTVVPASIIPKESLLTQLKNATIE